MTSITFLETCSFEVLIWHFSCAGSPRDEGCVLPPEQDDTDEVIKKQERRVHSGTSGKYFVCISTVLLAFHH